MLKSPNLVLFDRRKFIYKSDW